MNIVIAAPTGHIGSRVVQLLIQAGIRPSLLVRDPARLSEEVRASSEVRQGELHDPDFVLRATEGADALFWLIPTNYGSSDPIGEIVQLGQHAAEAVAKNKVSRTVLVSSAGAEQHNNDFVEGLRKVEKMMGDAGGNLVSLRPGFLFTNLLMSVDALRQGMIATTLPLDTPTPWNDPRDVGEIAAARLLSTAWTEHNVIDICGPHHLTFSEIANIVGSASSHAVRAVRVSHDEYRDALVGAGLSPAAAEALTNMERNMAGAVSDAVAPTLTTTPTSLAMWCYENLRPLLHE